MKKYKLFLTAAAFCVVVAFAAVWRQSSRADFSYNAQTNASPTPARDYLSAERAKNTAGQLESLLASDAITVSEAMLLASPSEKSKILRVGLTTNYSGARGDSSLEAAQPAKISLLSAKPNGGATARMRALELSPTLVFIASLDKNNNLVWWETAPDPRIFRAETADRNGLLSGETMYSENAEMLFSVPNDERIREINFYHPQWNGAGYALKPLGSLALDAE